MTRTDSARTLLTYGLRLCAILTLLAGTPASGQDCQPNQITDDLDISNGASQDCDGNQIPDECDISGGAPDCNSNGVPDQCESVVVQAQFDANSKTPCVGIGVAFQDLSTGLVNSYAWDFGDGMSDTVPNPTHAYAAAGSYAVSLTVSGPCGQDIETQTGFVTVLPLPQSSFTPDATDICPGDEVLFNNLSTGTNLAFSWDFGDTSTSSQESPRHTYQSPGSYTVSLTVVDGCGNDLSEQVNVIRVGAPPTPAFGVADGGRTCVGQGLAFTDLSTGDNLTSFAWVFGDGETSTEQHPVHNYLTPGVYTVQLQVGGTCGQEQITRVGVATVLEPAVAEFQVSATTVCVGDSIDFTDLSSGEVSGQEWNFGDGSGVQSTQANPSHTYQQPGTYTVLLRALSECGNDDETKPSLITVLAAPTAGFTQSATTICVGDQMQFTSTSSGVGNGSFTWDFGDGGTTSNEENPSRSFSVPGVHTVRLSVVGTCDTDATTASITVHDLPIPDFTVSDTQPCVDSSISFTSTSSGEGLSAFSWNFGDGTVSTLENPSHTYTTPGLYSVRLRVTGSCGSLAVSRDSFIDVQIGVSSDLSASATTICDGDTVDFTSLAGGSIASWAWDFGDSAMSSEENPSHTYAAAGSYTVSLRVDGACGNDTIVRQNLIVVSAVSVPEFEVAGATSVCVGDRVRFNDISTSPNEITDYSWDFGDNETSPNPSPSHVYDTPGRYSVMLEVVSTCGTLVESKNSLITVLAPPATDFSASPLTVCVGQPVAFVNESSGAGVSVVAWRFGDSQTSTQAAPSHSYAQPGTYSVELEIQGTCGTDMLTRPALIEVLDEDRASFDVEGENGGMLSICAGDSVDFVNRSASSGSGTAQWTFGDGGTSSQQNPSHTYTSPGLYSVSLSVTGTCGADDLTRPNLINVRAAAVPDFEVVGATTICVGDQVRFNDISKFPGEIDTRSWNFGDGSNSSNPSPNHRYNTPGRFSVSLQVVSNCGTLSVTKNNLITVREATSAGFSASPLAVCVGQPVTFVDESSGADLTVVAWSFGDGEESMQAAPTHSYAQPGTYSVELEIQGACGTDMLTRPALIEVLEEDLANFNAVGEAGGSLSICAGESVSFVNSSASSGSGTAQWTFGDGGTSSEQDPTHTYDVPGLYSVTLSVDGTCGSDELTRADLINVRTTAVPDFAVTGTASVCVGDTVQFNDLSTRTDEIISYRWDFGDGETSSDPSPSHAYGTPGLYTVGLEVESACGSLSETKGDLITVLETTAAEFSASPLTVCVGVPIAFVDESVGADLSVITWRFGDGEESTEVSPSHAYMQAGLYSVEFEVAGTCGTDSLTKPMLVEVLTESTVTFEVVGESSGTISVCTGQAIEFVNGSTGSGSATSLWSFGDGATSTVEAPTHSYDLPGMYDVTLTVNADCGSPSTTRPGVVMVLDPIVVNFEASVTTVCIGETVDFTQSATGAGLNGFRWNFGDETTATGEAPRHSYAAPGTYTVELVVAGTCGEVTATQAGLITVLEPVTAEFALSEAESEQLFTCLAVPLTFENQSSGIIAEYLWDFGDGSGSTEPSPTHAYEATGNYTVTMTTTGPCGTATKEVVDLVVVQDQPVAVSGLSYPESGFVNDILPIRWERAANATAYRVESRIGSQGDFSEFPQSPVEDDPTLEEYEIRTLVDRVGTWIFRVTPFNHCGDGEPTLGPRVGILPEEIIAHWPVGLSDCAGALLQDVEGGHDGTIEGGVVGCGRNRFREPTQTLEFRSQGLVLGGQLPVVGGDFTVSLWVQPLSGGTSSRTFLEITPDPSRAGDPTTEPLRARWNPGESAFIIEHNSPPGVAVRIDDVQPAWHQLTISRRDDILTVFLDGRVEGSLPHTLELGEQFAFGGSRDGLTRFAGSVDETLYESRARGENEVLALILDAPTTLFLGGESNDGAVAVASGTTREVLRLELRTGTPASPEGFVLENLTIELQDITPDVDPRPFDFVDELILLTLSNCDGSKPLVEELGRFVPREASLGRALFDLSDSNNAGIALARQRDLCFAVELVLNDTAFREGRVVRALVKTPDDLVVSDGADPAFIAGPRRVAGSAAAGPELHLRDSSPELSLRFEARSGIQKASRGTEIEAHAALLESNATEDIHLLDLTYLSVEGRQLPELSNIELLLDDQLVAVGQLTGDRTAIRFPDAAVLLPQSSQGRLVLRAAITDTVDSAFAMPAARHRAGWIVAIVFVAVLVWRLAAAAGRIERLGMRLRGVALRSLAGVAAVALVSCGPALIGGGMGLGLSSGGGGGGGGGLGPGQFQLRFDEGVNAVGARTEAEIELRLTGDVKGPIFELDES